MKPCDLGPRHKWTWVKNVTKSSVTGRTASFTSKGLYRCECGAKKLGAHNHNAPREGEGLLAFVKALAGEA